MARRKRVPYRPDAFQAHGRRIAQTLLNRSGAAVAALALAAVAFVVAFVLLRSRSIGEERAWNAYHRARGDVGRLEEALTLYGSTSARPYLLFALARAELDPPGGETDEGREEPQERETDEERSGRLGGAEEALRTLVREYPEHVLHVYALQMLGLVLEEQGRHREAASRLEEALPEAPASLDPKLRYDIGRNYLLAGERTRARRYLEKAAEARRQVVVRNYPTEADWIANAKYLLAQAGAGVREIPPPQEESGDAPEEEPRGAGGPEELDGSAGDDEEEGTGTEPPPAPGGSGLFRPGGRRPRLALREAPEA